MKKSVANTIFGTKNIYSSLCTTLGKKLGGVPIEVDGISEIGYRISRAGVMLVKDENGFIYELNDTCLTDSKDVQINAICSDCESYWLRKLRNREYRLVGTTAEHPYVFGKKLTSRSNELREYMDNLSAKNYLAFFGNSMKDLSLVDDEVMIPFAENTSIMIATLKRINDNDLYLLVISDFDSDEKFVASSIISKENGEDKIEDILFDYKRPVAAFVESANTINKTLIEGLKVF